MPSVQVHRILKITLIKYAYGTTSKTTQYSDYEA